MAHNKERLSHKPPVTRVKIGGGVIGDLSSIGFHPTLINSKDSRYGAKNIVNVSSILAAIREAGKLRPGKKRHSRNF